MPRRWSPGDLAEFCGIMLGDGHIGTGQLWVTVNAKTDLPYVTYVQDLFAELFLFRPMEPDKPFLT